MIKEFKEKNIFKQVILVFSFLILLVAGYEKYQISFPDKPNEPVVNLSQQCKNALPKNQLTEFFSFNCSHCAKVEPFLRGDVNKIQVIYNKDQESMARFLFALKQQVDVKDKILLDAFMLVNEKFTQDEIIKFVDVHHLNRDKFVVDMAKTDIAGIKNLQNMCSIDTIPRLIKNGKMTSPDLSGGYKEAVDLANKF